MRVGERRRAAIGLKRVCERGAVTRHRIHGAVCASLVFGPVRVSLCSTGSCKAGLPFG